MNSKSEYKRCALQRLATKIGENELKKWEEIQQDGKAKELEEHENNEKQEKAANTISTAAASSEN